VLKHVEAGPGLRFIIDLEKAKPTRQIGKVQDVINTPGMHLDLQHNVNRKLPMAHKLDVYLGQALVGELSKDKDGRLWFQYGAAWSESVDASTISQSLPLQTEPFRQNECCGFFGSYYRKKTIAP